MEIHLGWCAWPTQILARIVENVPLCPIWIQPKVQVHISNRLAIIEHLVFRLTHLLPNLAIIYNLIKYASLLLLIAKDNYLVFEVNRPYIWRILSFKHVHSFTLWISKILKWPYFPYSSVFSCFSRSSPTLTMNMGIV